MRQFPSGPVVRTLLSLPRTRVQSLVGKLRSSKQAAWHSKKKKKKPKAKGIKMRKTKYTGVSFPQSENCDKKAEQLIQGS